MLTDEILKTIIGIAEAWGGNIDYMLDTIPVISAVGKLPSFFLATGFSGHGFASVPPPAGLPPTSQPGMRRSSTRLATPISGWSTAGGWSLGLL